MKSKSRPQGANMDSQNHAISVKIWTLELTVSKLSKILKIHTLRNSKIMFSRRRGFIFQGVQHLEK